MIGWETAISALITIGIVVGGFILQSLRELSKKVDCTMSKSDCDKLHEANRTEAKLEARELWDALSSHSHTGLPTDSRVTR